MNQEVRQKKVLVTGANGFIGSHLTEALLKKGYKVKCLVRKTSDLRWLSDLDVELFFGSLFDKSFLEEVVSEVDFIFHVAALTKAKSRKEFHMVNYEGTKNLIETCYEKNPHIKRFVYISTQSVVGPSKNFRLVDEKSPFNPISEYGKSKLLAEMEVLKYKGKLPITIIRPPAVYGPRDKDIYLFFKFINKGLKPLFGKKESYISLIYVKDLVEGIILSAESEKGVGQIYFLADDRPYSLRETEKVIQDALKVKAIYLRIPVFIFMIVAFFSELIGKIKGKTAVLNSEKVKELCQKYWLCSSSKAKDELGFSPKYTFEKGVKETVEWYKSNGWL